MKIFTRCTIILALTPTWASSGSFILCHGASSFPSAVENLQCRVYSARAKASASLSSLAWTSSRLSIHQEEQATSSRRITRAVFFQRIAAGPWNRGNLSVCQPCRLSATCRVVHVTWPMRAERSWFESSYAGLGLNSRSCFMVNGTGGRLRQTILMCILGCDLQWAQISNIKCINFLNL